MIIVNCSTLKRVLALILRPFQVVKCFDTARIPFGLLTIALFLIEITAADRTQTLAVLRTQHPDW